MIAELSSDLGPGEAPYECVEAPDQLARAGCRALPTVFEQGRQVVQKDVDHLLAVGEIVGYRRGLLPTRL